MSYPTVTAKHIELKSTKSKISESRSMMASMLGLETVGTCSTARKFLTLVVSRISRLIFRPDVATIF